MISHLPEAVNSSDIPKPTAGGVEEAGKDKMKCDVKNSGAAGNAGCENLRFAASVPMLVKPPPVVC